MIAFLQQYGWVLASLVVLLTMYEVGIRTVQPDIEEKREEEGDYRA